MPASRTDLFQIDSYPNPCSSACSSSRTAGNRRHPASPRRSTAHDGVQRSPVDSTTVTSLPFPSVKTLQFELNGGEPVASSIPATEHSVMTAWASEREAIENMITHFGGGLFSVVMDSYDYAAVTDPSC